MKDLSRLVWRQYNIHNNNKKFYQYCLHGCTSQEVLKNPIWKDESYMSHKDLSSQKLTIKRDMFKFTETEYQLPFIFSIYHDFESVLPKQDSCEPSSSKSFTAQYQHHEPCEICIYVKCSEGQYFERTHMNLGDNIGEKFFGPGPSYSNHL